MAGGCCAVRPGGSGVGLGRLAISFPPPLSHRCRKVNCRANDVMGLECAELRKGMVDRRWDDLLIDRSPVRDRGASVASRCSRDHLGLLRCQ